MPQTSMTDLEAVRPKGPRRFVVVVALLAAAAAIWGLFFGEAGPIGEPEDPAKILLVSADNDTATMLGELGFTVEVGTVADFESKAASQGIEAKGPAAALQWADHAGYGYVVFGQPSQLGFTELAVHPKSADIKASHAFAAFSVGDLARPHLVTVNDKPAAYALPPYIDALRCLFEQPHLAATLVGENKVSMDAAPLFEQVAAAVDLLGAYGLIDSRARRLTREQQESLDEPEKASPKPLVLAKALERTRAYPLANGGILLFVEMPSLRSPRDSEARLVYGGHEEPWYLPPGSTSMEDRQACPAATPLRSRKLEVFAGGAVLLATVPNSGTKELWTSDAKATQCSLQRAKTRNNIGQSLDISAAGVLAQAVFRDDSALVEVYNPEAELPQQWHMPGCTRVSRVSFIGPTQVALTCGYRPPPENDPFKQVEDEAPVDMDVEPPVVIPAQTWLVLLDTQDGAMLGWPLPPTPRAAGHAFWPRLIPGPKLRLLVPTDYDGYSIATATVDTATLFATPPLDPAFAQPAFVPEGELGPSVLRAEAFGMEALELDTTLTGLSISPDGKYLGLALDGYELSRNAAIYDLATKTTTRIAINRWTQHSVPVFTAKGEGVLFESLYEGNDGNATVARFAAL